jgi:hypothetical protein
MVGSVRLSERRRRGVPIAQVYGRAMKGSHTHCPRCTVLGRVETSRRAEARTGHAGRGVHQEDGTYGPFLPPQALRDQMSKAFIER